MSQPYVETDRTREAREFLFEVAASYYVNKYFPDHEPPPPLIGFESVDIQPGDLARLTGFGQKED